MQPTRHFSRNDTGMTIVETVIVVTIITAVILGFILALDRTLTEASRTGAIANLNSQASRAIDRIEHEVVSASKFHATIASPFSDPYEPGAGWSHVGDGENDRVLILSQPATSLRDRATSRELTYQDGPSYTCSATDLRYNPVHTYRAILFVDNNTLYKRFLTDETTALCNSQIQKQSCPADAIGTWPAICEVRDEVIARDVSDFDVSYYRAGESSAIADAYTDPSLLAKAVSVDVVLTLSEPSGADPASSTVTIHATRAN